jgi:hypothetical protein
MKDRFAKRVTGVICPKLTIIQCTALETKARDAEPKLLFSSRENKL